MATIGEWLAGEGLDSLQDLFRIGGTLVDARQEQANIQDRARVHQYSRRLDLFNLAMHRQALDLDQRLNRRLATTGYQEAGQAQREVDFFNAEARLRARERDYNAWLVNSQREEIARTSRAEANVAYRRTMAERAGVTARQGVLAAQDPLLRQQYREQRAVETAGQYVVAAERDEQATGRRATVARLGAGRQALAAGRDRIGAERAVVARSGALRVQTRAEQAVQEMGAGAVSGAARGMRGSYRRTTAARAMQEAVRDIELYQLEDGLRQIQLSEQAAKLEATGVDVEHRAAQEQARIDTAQARTGEAQVRLIQGGRTARLGLDVEGARQRGEAFVLGEQMRLTQDQEQLGYARYRAAGQASERLRRGELVQRAGYSLQEASSTLRAKGAAITREKAITSGDKASYDVWLGTTARQINDWQLKNLPSLPDYEGMSARAAMGAVMRTAAEVID